MARAEQRMSSVATEKEREFLTAVVAGCSAMIRVAERMGAEARRMMEGEIDPVIRRRLARIADAAPRVPAAPPATFYEALNTLMFLFRAIPAIDGNGISVLGHLDRTLIPFYRRDVKSGALTTDEAKDLVRHFLSIVDTRFDMRGIASGHYGSNTAIALGGCDADGVPVCNEMTRMVLEAHRELGLVDPKVNLRIAPGAPSELFDLASEFLAAGGNSLAIFNDEVVIRANVRMGKAERDCRLYVGGGCQENVLENCEVNSRATMYLNLLNVFLMGFFPERWREFSQREGIAVAAYAACPDFASLYQAFLRNLRAVFESHVRERNRTEREGGRYNPCPAHSATMDDCIAKGLDMMEGGTRYSFGSISFTGVGTLADSLYALREAVFTQRFCTLDQMAAALASDFEGQESLRCRLAGRIPKFGQEDAGVREFAARVFADLADLSTGMPNGRGGRYEASLFSFRSFVDFGRMTGATPDGRRAGAHLSPGMGPSFLALGARTSVGKVISSVEPLDLSLYPVVAVLDVKMPQVPVAAAPRVIGPVIRRFIESGGSVIQINCVSQRTLVEAKEHPELHPDLVVRVSGYSSYFQRLTKEIQDEIIERTVTET